jgi:drug/metabolite transporter (DMT)-like permease
VNITAVILTIVAALAHAIWNFAAKRASDGGPPFVWLYQTVSSAIRLPVAAVALIMYDARPQWSWLLAMVVSAALHVAYSLILQRGYAVGDMSVVYPVARGSGPLLSVSAAVVLLGERPGPVGLVGAGAVVLGVFVIGLRRSPDRPGPAAMSLFYGGLTGAAIAGYTLWDAHSMNALAVSPLIYSGASSVVQSLVLAPHALKTRRRVAELWRTRWREVVTIAVLAPTAYVLVLYAMRMAPVSLVAPARELSIVPGGLLAWRWLGEPDPARRLCGAVIVLFGIVAIAVA